MLKRSLKRSLNTKMGSEIDFCSNDYLGLSRDQELQEEVFKTLRDLSKEKVYQKILNGSSGSRLISGNHPFIELVEEQLAKAHQSEKALIFPNGFLANYTLLSCLLTQDDILYLDEEVHASMWEGARACQARLCSFSHNNTEDLKNKMKRTRFKYKRAFIALQTLYPTQGDIAPLEEIVNLATEYEGDILADEAHATGLYGPEGLGLIIQKKLTQQIAIRMHTFSKALGAYGAIVFCNSKIKRELIQRGRPFIYSTALPLYNYVLMQKVHEKMRSFDLKRAQLNHWVGYLRTKISCLFRPPLDPTCPVFSFEVSTLEEALCYRRECEIRGIKIYILTPPSTRHGKIRVRVCLHAFNTQHEIDQLLEVFQALEQEKLENCL